MMLEAKIEEMLARFLGYGALMRIAKSPEEFERLYIIRGKIWGEITMATFDFPDDKKAEFLDFLNGKTK